MLRNVIAIVLAVAIGAIGYSYWTRKDAEESPLNVMITQMRTRAIIEHERSVTVWYRACPEVKGVNPQVMVIWPAKLNYELDLSATRLSLGADGVLTVDAPPIRVDDPSVPSDFGEYLAQTSFWTLDNEQAIVRREMQKATPMARHLTAYFLRNDVGLSEYFKEELETYLRAMTGALGLAVSRVEIHIPEQEVKIPPRPEMTLCEGTVAVANGLPFARRQADGAVIGVYPKKSPAQATPVP
ncbi:MAG: hypothetical protein K0Q92_3594 [Steroidobacteraceae bacterium]|jgi:hypothetical protein|nr:hypothetical protein [Steroidobacteraceae bacterium]